MAFLHRTTLGIALAGAALCAPVDTDATLKRWMRSMSVREMAAQLLVLPFFGEALHAGSPEHNEYQRWVRETGIGGLVLVNRIENGTVRSTQPYAMAAFLNRMQRAAKVPLIVAGDFERGSSMRIDTRVKFPHAMAFAAGGDPSETRWLGAFTAREARALGVHWVLAPVSDVNNNPDNPIINIRSFGEDPREVAAHVRAFIEGAHEDRTRPVLVTAKHFPGHGDTAIDTHLNLAVIPAARERLEQVELYPFRAAIAAGADTVMTAHIAAPALGPPDLPATLAPAVLTGLLRNELGFRGLTVTDALDMHGIAKGWSSGEAAVRALQAGADVLLMPANPQEALAAVSQAIEQGRLSRRRIEQSVERLLAAKIRVGLDRQRLVDLEAISEHLDAPEALARAQRVADRAVTLVRNEGDLIPLGKTSPCFLILPETRQSLGGRVFHVEIQKRAPGAAATILDPQIPECELERVAANTAACNPVVVAAFASVAAYRGSAGLGGTYPKLLDAILASGRRVVLVALGNPYLLRNFPQVSAYVAAFSTAPPSEVATVKALFGEIPFQGRLPVTIPGFAKRGEGLATQPSGNR